MLSILSSRVVSVFILRYTLPLIAHDLLDAYDVMLTLRGFSAWIVANGTPLPEYLVAVDAAAQQISCWIPSDSNQVWLSTRPLQLNSIYAAIRSLLAGP